MQKLRARGNLSPNWRTGFFGGSLLGSHPRSEARITAQAMNLAGFEDVRRLEQTLGHDFFAEIMLIAEPGWFDERHGSSGAVV